MHYYDNNNSVPIINVDLLATICSVLTFKSNSGRKITKNRRLKEKIEDYYNKFYKKIGHIKQDYTNLSHIFKYIYNDIITNYENNIKLHFYDHLVKYIKFLSRNYSFSKKNTKSVACKLMTSNECYKLNEKNLLKNHFYLMINNFVLPKRKLTIKEELKEVPQKYLPIMINMTKEIDLYNQKDDKNKYKIKTLNIFSNYTSGIPINIPIDTTIILDILFEKGKTIYYKMPMKQKRNELWTLFFAKLMNKYKDRKKKKFVFGDLIYTNGVSASIMLVTKNLYGKKIKRTSKIKNKIIYATEEKRKILRSLKGRKVVGVDPGKRNLIYLTDGKNKVSYSCMQRRYECGFKLKAKKIRERKTKRMEIIENILSKYNSKICIEKEYLKYLKIREKYKADFYSFYFDPFYRKLKWKSYIKNQISEEKLVKRIKNKFGKNPILAYGDWSNKKQSKYYIPTKGIGLKRRLSKNFQIYNIWEYNTSKKCCNCGSNNKKFMVRKNPRPYKNNKRLVNGLLHCENGLCDKYYNRNLNGSLNIRKIMVNIINGKD